MVGVEMRHSVRWRIRRAAVVGGFGIGFAWAALILLATRLFGGEASRVVSGAGLVTLTAGLLASAGTLAIGLRLHSVRPVIIPLSVLVIVFALMFGLPSPVGDRTRDLDFLPHAVIIAGAIALVFAASSSERRRAHPLTSGTALFVAVSALAALAPSWSDKSPLIVTATLSPSSASSAPARIPFTADTLLFSADSVIAETGKTSESGNADTRTTTLVSRSLRDGSAQWRSTIGTASVSTYATSSTVIVGTLLPPQLSGLDIRTGAVLWTAPRASAFGGLPSKAMSEGVLLRSDATDSVLARGDDRTGGVMWRKELDGCAMVNDPRVIGTVVAVATACPAPTGIGTVEQTLALDVATGKPTSAPPERESRATTIGDDRVLFGRDDEVSIAVGASSRVRRSLGTGELNVSPDRQQAIFVDSRTGRTTLVRAGGRPDVVVRDVGRQSIRYPSRVAWVGSHYAVTVGFGYLSVIDTNTDAVQRPSAVVCALEYATADAIVTVSSPTDTCDPQSHEIFTGLTR